MSEEESIEEHLKRVGDERLRAAQQWSAKVLRDHGLPPNADKAMIGLHYDDGAILTLDLTRTA